VVARKSGDGFDAGGGHREKREGRRRGERGRGRRGEAAECRRRCELCRAAQQRDLWTTE
jgi:hypothetical protein